MTRQLLRSVLFTAFLGLLAVFLVFWGLALLTPAGISMAASMVIFLWWGFLAHDDRRNENRRRPRELRRDITRVVFLEEYEASRLEKARNS